MKKVLTLAYDFPPYVSVGGLRPYSWYKYFSQFDVYPIVVTRQWSNEYKDYRDFISASISSDTIIEKSEKGTIIKTPYHPNLSNKLLLKYGKSKFKIIRKIISAYYEFAQFVFITGPKKQLYIEAKKYIENNDVDVILATGEPYVLFKYASQLSRKYNIPWIADYRDTWTQNRDASNYILKKKWESFFEKKYLNNVKIITTVETVFKNNISALLPTKEYRIISNGYDSEFIKQAIKIPQGNEKMSIAFVGAIYDWHPIESFFEVCSNFVKENKHLKFKINFYGLNQNHFKGDINNMINSKFPELSSYVSIYPTMPNEELLQHLATNNLFLLFNYYSYMGTKIYDYLGLKRTIILCYSNDLEALNLKKKYYNLEINNSVAERVQEKLMTETKAGVVVKDSTHLRTTLIDFYKEFQKNGYIECNSIDSEQYSREIQVKKMSAIISELTK